VKTTSRFAESVKRQSDNPDSCTQLSHYLETHIQAADSYAAELEVYAGWLQHGLAKPEHVFALMTSERGIVQ